MSARDVLRANGQRFHALAHRLSADDWSRHSLCEHWSNHDVLAHLVVGLSAPLREIAADMLSHRGSFDLGNAAAAQTLAAARSPAELLDDFGQLMARPRGVGRYFPRRLLLGDHVTHELDILFALDREPDIPPDVLVAVLNTQVAVPNPFVPAFRNSRGLRLRAIDARWAHGDGGPAVEGRAADLVSVLGNRPKALARLVGAGVAVLDSRLSRPTRTVGSESPCSGPPDPGSRRRGRRRCG